MNENTKDPERYRSAMDINNKRFELVYNIFLKEDKVHLKAFNRSTVPNKKSQYVTVCFHFIRGIPTKNKFQGPGPGIVYPGCSAPCPLCCVSMCCVCSCNGGDRRCSRRSAPPRCAPFAVGTSSFLGGVLCSVFVCYVCFIVVDCCWFLWFMLLFVWFCVLFLFMLEVSSL